ncbi:hypothetical protein [Sphingobium sp. CAP-1]|uniref:hypothetical protein n=1 Tax=Sphingobium sp. CAP-1 TaxID=2676077 RepID=UPI0012BB480E|nr:hypothetical protein [Sphingobium sp. CAP-1]QGP80003.1 hypothetical protein GL174_14180 [Sphingobium sp. CAP-1]
MAGINIGQVNFSKGVLSKDLHGRVDIASYQAGMKSGVNVVLTKRGGFQNRMGTRFVYRLPGPGRLFPFAYSLDQPYALVFTQGAMRPMAFGGMVLEEELQIENITNENPATVTIAYHGYAVGDQFLPRGVVGMSEINERVLTILSVIDDNNFTVDVDASAFGAFTSATGGITRFAAAPPPPPDPVVPPVVEPPPPPVTGGGGRRGRYEQIV